MKIAVIGAAGGEVTGSAGIRLVVDDAGREKSVIFSGDLGPRGIPILRDYQPFHPTGLVFWQAASNGYRVAC